MGCQTSIETSFPLTKKHSFSLDLLVQSYNNPESQTNTTNTKYYDQPIIQESIKYYHKLIEESPFLMDYPFDGLGCVQDQVGCYQGKVVQWYRTNRVRGIIQGNPYDALSLCYSLKQQVLSGEKWYLQMIGKYPSIFQLYYGLANVYYKAKNFDKAEIYYRKSFELNPRLQKAYQNMAAICCYHKYDNKQAAQWATFTLKINKNNQYAKLIHILVNQSNINRYASLIKLLHKFPTYARIHNSIANQCLEAGNVTDAIQWLLQATYANSNYFAPYCGLAIIYNSQKEYTKAIQMCHSALTINPNHYQPYASLAEAYYALGNLQSAALNYKKCIQIKPEFSSQCNQIMKNHIEEFMKKQQTCMKNKQLLIQKQQSDQLLNKVFEIPKGLGVQMSKKNYIQLEVRGL